MASYSQISRGQRAQIGILHQHSAGDLLQGKFLLACFYLHQPQVFLGSKLFARLRRVARSGYRLHKQLGNLFRSSSVDGPVHANHAPKGRNRVRFLGTQVGFQQRLASGRAAGIGVLDDGASRFIEVLRQVPRRLQVHNVVEGELFALKLLAVGNARA